MTEILTKPFRESHLDIFLCQPKYQAQCGESVKWMAALGGLGQCGSQCLDGRILYVSAHFSVAPGVTEVFLLPSTYVPQHKLAFYRHVKWWLQFLLNEGDTRRLQTWGDDSWESDRWLLKLGFQREGVLLRYKSSDENVSIWGMVRTKF